MGRRNKKQFENMGDENNANILENIEQNDELVDVNETDLDITTEEIETDLDVTTEEIETDFVITNSTEVVIDTKTLVVTEKPKRNLDSLSKCEYRMYLRTGIIPE